MPRRRCCGLVDQEPNFLKFAPEGQTKTQVITLQVEELESIRLKDIESMDQAACATAMGVSRTTFQRILQSGRTKIASALVYGQTIVIRGGCYMVKNRKFECKVCSEIWEVEPCTEGGKHGYEIPCPKCGSMDKIKLGEDGARHACGGHNHKHNHGNDGGCCSGH
ncbi:MAG: DUF134 domain-containing protein [Sporomusaceae bacterium]|nr:DUF134 domain-containing protein [Sporomusaceae bacterium]